MSQVYSSIVVFTPFLRHRLMTLRNCPARLLIVTCLVGRGPYSIYFLKRPTKPCCFRYDCVWPLPCFLDNNIHNIECDVSVYLFIFKNFLHEPLLITPCGILFQQIHLLLLEAKPAHARHARKQGNTPALTHNSPPPTPPSPTPPFSF